MYTVMLDLKDRSVLVVGGGTIATRRIKGFLQEGAAITVVAPTVSAEINEWEAKNQLCVKRKKVGEEDLLNVFFIVVATNDKAVNKFVKQHIKNDQLVNMASGFSDGNIQIPAQFSRGRLSLAISTDGASPLLTKRIKEELSSTYDESYTQYTQFLYECRVLIHRLNVSKSRKHELLTEIIDDQYRLSLVKQREFLQQIEKYK